MRENVINFWVVILYFVVFIVQHYIIYLLYIHCAKHMLNPISTHCAYNTCSSLFIHVLLKIMCQVITEELTHNIDWRLKLQESAISNN